MFKDVDLEITGQANLSSVDYLNITMNVANGEFRPYKKPNATTRYVNKNSDHPETGLKDISKAANLRLNKLSSSKRIFD